MLALFISTLAIISTCLYLYFITIPNDNFIWWVVPVLFIASWIIIFFLYLMFLLILSLFHSKKNKVIKPKRIYSFFIYHTAVFLRQLFNIKVVFENSDLLPKDKNFLLVLNHQSLLDPIVTVSCFKNYQLAYIFKDSLMKIPFIGRYLHASGFLPIDRKNNRKALENIMVGVKRLQEGGVLAIYPEGTRSKGPKINQFRDGAFKPALKAKVPIVVMALDGFYKKIVGLPFFPSKVFLKVCEVIPYEKLKDLQTNNISAHIRNTMISNLEDARVRHLWLQ